MKIKAPEYVDYEIILLKNSYYFALNKVFIIVREKEFRLIVIADKKLHCDQTYETLRGTKIAFDRMYKKKLFNPTKRELIKREWTHQYSPEKPWMEEMMKIVAKGIPEKPMEEIEEKKNEGNF